MPWMRNSVMIFLDGFHLEFNNEIVLWYINSLNIIQAEQRAREESEKLRQQEREQIAEKRRRDLVCCLLWLCVYTYWSFKGDLLLWSLLNILFLCFYFVQTLRARVVAKTEEKKLELLFLQWSDHHKKLCNFIR